MFIRIDRKIIKIISLSLLIVLLYIFYRSFFSFDENRINSYLKFIIIIIFFFIINSVIFFLDKETQRIYNITIFSLILIFYLSEVFLNFFNFSNFDARTKFQIYKDEGFIPAIHPYNFRNSDFRPVSGISNKKTILCTENFIRPVFKSDKYGFNNPNYIYDNIENKNNILFLGDSFVFGECVKSENTFVNLIRKKINKNIFNFSYGGNGPLEKLSTLIEYGEIVNPKHIFWFYYEGNDLWDLHDSLDKKIMNVLNDDYISLKLKENDIKKNEILNKFLINSVEKELTNNKQSKLTKFKNFLKLQKVRNLLIQGYFDLYVSIDKNKIINDSLKYENELKIFKEILLKTQKIASSYNSKLTIVYLPSHKRYLVNNEKLYFKEDLIDFFKKNNLDYFDADSEIFSQFNFKKWKSSQSGHYNKFGQNLLHIKILEKLNY